MNWQDLDMTNIPPVDAFLDATDNEVLLDFYRAMRYEVIRLQENITALERAISDHNRFTRAESVTDEDRMLWTVLGGTK